MRFSRQRILLYLLIQSKVRCSQVLGRCEWLSEGLNRSTPGKFGQLFAVLLARRRCFSARSAFTNHRGSILRVSSGGCYQKKRTPRMTLLHRVIQPFGEVLARAQNLICETPFPHLHTLIGRRSWWHTLCRPRLSQEKRNLDHLWQNFCRFVW